ncbi:MAG: DUF3098 domain-containing protein [Candidatus Competibacteraceae bacterium]|nr:DUF3098 domain-containing protein [Candidatus Competibacteraceae bacterium]
MSKTKQTNPSANESQLDAFPLRSKNVWVMGAGILIILIGFLLMIGGGSNDPNEFNPEIFNARRITLAPIIVLLGFVVIGTGIIKKFKK